MASRNSSNFWSFFLVAIFLGSPPAAQCETIPALGHGAQLGEFYDARTRSFLGVTIFNKKPPEELISAVDISSTAIDYKIVDKPSDKLSLLSLSASLKAEVLLGMIKIEGSGKFVNKKQHSIMDVQAVVNYKVRTKREILNTGYREFQEALEPNTLANNTMSATHVVVAIEYGGDVNIQMTSKADHKDDVKEVEGKFQLSLNAMMLMEVNAQADITYNDKVLFNSTETSFVMVGDMELNSTVPQTAADFRQLLRIIPEKVKESNDEKGKPMAYTLFPVEKLQTLLKYELKNNLFVRELDEVIMDQYVRMLDELERVQLKLNELEDFLMKHKACTSLKDLNEMKQLSRSYKDKTRLFNMELRQALYAVRTTESNSPETLKDLLTNYTLNEPLSAKNVELKADKALQKAEKKIGLYNIFQTYGFDYFGRTGNLKKLLMTVPDKIIYAIFLHESDGENWTKNWNMFHGTLNRNFSKLVIVDCAFEHDGCFSNVEQNKTVTKQYFRGKLLSDDVLAHLARAQDQKTLLRISAVGRVQKLGDLYYAPSNEFLQHESLFKNVPTPIKESVSTGEPIKVVDNTFAEKFKYLKLEPPPLLLQILVDPSRWTKIGRTFQEIVEPNSVSKTLVHEFSTFAESLPQPKDSLFDSIDISALADSKATHYVHKIRYGGKTSVSLFLPKSDANIKRMKDDFRIIEKKTPISILNSPRSWQNVTLPEEYFIEYESDLVDHHSRKVRTPKDLRGFLNNFQGTKKVFNNGTGIPVLYIMYPLQNLQKYFGAITKSVISTPDRDLTSNRVQKLGDILEGFYKIDAEITNIRRDLTTVLISGRTVMTPQDVTEVQKIESDTKEKLRDFTAVLNDILGKRRTSVEVIEEWEPIEKQFREITRAFRPHQSKLKFLQWMSEKFPDIEYFGSNSNLIFGLHRPEIRDKFVHVLRYKMNFTTDRTDSGSISDDQWGDNFMLLTKFATGKEYNRAILLDCDHNDPKCENLETPSIQMYRNGDLIHENVLPMVQSAKLSLQRNGSRILERQAYGRSVPLGSLYNARTESFTGNSLFKVGQEPNSYPEGLVNTQAASFQKRNHQLVEIGSSNITQRFAALSLFKDVQLTLLFDPDNSLEKSGKFLDTSLDFTKGLITTFISKVESLNLTSNSMLQNFDPSQLNLVGSTNPEDPNAPTHFLSEIRLGASSIITVGKSNKQTAEDEVKTEKCFDHVKNLLKIPNLKVNNSIIDSSCNLEIFTDFSRVETAKTYREKLNIVLEELRQKTQNHQVLSDNDGPVIFILEPIERLFEPLGIVTPRISYNQLSPKFDPTPFTVYFSQILAAMQESNELYKTALRYNDCLPQAVLDNALQKNRNMVSKFSDFRRAMKIRLDQVKNGKKEERELTHELNDQITHFNIRNEISDTIPQKIKMFKFFNTSSNSVHYFGKLSTDSNFQDFLREQTDRIVYAIVIKDPSDSNSWTSLTNLYTSQLKRTFTSLAVVDCDFSYDVCTTAVKNVMHQYWREKTVSSDVVKDFKPAVDQRPTIQVSAVGRNHQIGDLYNARTNKFTGFSLFKDNGKKPEFNLTPMNSETGVLVEDRLDEKFNQLNIQPISLRYSILLNSPELSHRIGKTFQQKTRRDSKSITKTLIHIYNSKKESFQNPDENSFEFFSINQLQKTEATHFVQEIVLGAQTTISLTTSVDSRVNLDGLLENFRQHLFNNESAMPVKLPVGVSLAFASDLMESLENTLPVTPTPQDLSRFFQEFSSIRKANGGRGEPVVYVMFPLENLFQHLGTLKNPRLRNNELESWRDEEEERSVDLSIEFARVIDALNAADNNFSEMLRKMEEHREYVNSQTLQHTKNNIEKLRTLKKMFSVFDRNTGKLTSNANLNSTFFTMKDAALKSGLFDPNFELLDDKSFKRLTSKILFFETMASQPFNFTFIGRGQKVSDSMKSPALKDRFVFVFFYKQNFADSQVDLWDQNLDLLTVELSTKPYNRIVFVDCDFDDPLCATILRPIIQLYRNGRLLRGRVLDDWKEAIRISNVAGRKEEIRRQAPGRRVALGDLYNIHSEKFIGSSLFQTKEDGGSTFDLSSNFVKLTPASRDPDVVFPETTGLRLSDRFEFLQVESNQQLSWILQEKPGERSGRFLDLPDDLTQIFVRSHQRGTARLNLFSSTLPDFLAPENLMSDPNDLEMSDQEKIQNSPTHFVREIRLGSNTIVALKNPGTEEQGAGDKNCSVLLKSCIKKPNAASSINLDSLLNCDFYFFTDLRDLENDQLSSKEDFPNLISILARDSETPLERLNYAPVLSFVLEPVESLVKPLGIIVPPHKTYQDLPNLLKTQLNPLTDSFSRLSKKLVDLEKLSASMFDKECITPDAETAVAEEIQKIKVDLTVIKSSARERFIQVKSKTGSANATALIGQLQQMVTNLLGRSKVFEDQRQKLDFFHYQMNTGNSSNDRSARYLGRKNRNFDKVIFSCNEKPIYILYFRDISNPGTITLWQQTTRIFFNFLDVPENNCFIIDCDFPSNFDRCKQNAKPIVIHQIVGAEVKSTDFLLLYNENEAKVEDQEIRTQSLVNDLLKQQEYFNGSLGKMENSLYEITGNLDNKSNKNELKILVDDGELKHRELGSKTSRLEKLIWDLEQEGAEIKGTQQAIRSSVVEVANVTNHLETCFRELESSFSAIKVDQARLNETQIDLRKTVNSGKNIRGVLMWRIPNVRQLLKRRRNRDPLYSDPFYTDPYGYKLEAQVKINGDEESFVSVYVRILSGEFDTILRWPFAYTIRVTLYDQTAEENPQHFWREFDLIDEEYERPTARGSSPLGLGDFVDHDTLLGSGYVVNDTAFIRVEVVLPEESTC